MKIEITNDPPKQQPDVIIRLDQRTAQILRNILGTLSINDNQTNGRCSFEEAAEFENLYNRLAKAL